MNLWRVIDNYLIVQAKLFAICFLLLDVFPERNHLYFGEFRGPVKIHELKVA